MRIKLYKILIASSIILLPINSLMSTHAEQICDKQWQDDQVGSQIIANSKTYISYFGRCTFLSPVECKYPAGNPAHYGYIPEFYRGVMEYQQCGETNLCGKRFSEIQKKNITEWIVRQHDPIFTVVYVHGWHHNAKAKTTWNHNDKSDNGNFTKFNDLLARVSYQLRFKHPEVKYKVLGVYVGWQGEKTNNKFKTLFTVGNRACAADVIAFGISPENCKTIGENTSYPESDLHADLVELSKKLQENSHSKLLIIGHSFGGRIVSNLFLPDIENNKVSPLGNQALISTINPAIGAYRYAPLYRDNLNGTSFQNPTWINFTSDGDTATKWLYPIARIFGRVKGLSTIGHKNDYITHELKSDFLGSYECHYNGKKSNFLNYCSVKDSEIIDAFNYSTFELKPNWVTNTYMGIKSFIVFPEIEKDDSEIYKVDKFCGKDKKVKCAEYKKYHLSNVTLDADVAVLKITPKENSKYPLNGALWNISTDKKFIDFRGDKGGGDGKHNAYVNATLISLLVDRTLDLDSESLSDATD